MIRNYHTTITDYIFNKKTFSELKESTFGDKWPVVYIIEDKGKGWHILEKQLIYVIA